MAYLDNSSVTVEAILTKKGRELLARGEGFEITQFSVADDEIDYRLWKPTHPNGTNFYGAVIEGLPLVEAVPDETQSLRSKLVTLPRGTSKIPVISLGFQEIELEFGRNTSVPISPQTTEGLNGPGFGYTAILYDGTAASITGTGLPDNFGATTPGFFGDVASVNAVVVRGTNFTISPRDVPSRVDTQLTIIGNQTGATITIPVVIRPEPSS